MKHELPLRKKFVVELYSSTGNFSRTLLLLNKKLIYDVVIKREKVIIMCYDDEYNKRMLLHGDLNIQYF